MARQWTEEEIAFLKNNWEVSSAKEMAQALDRSTAGVRDKLKKFRLVKDHSWSDEDCAFLKENYGKMPNVEITEKLNRSMISVNSQARKLDLSFFDIELGTEYGYYTLESIFMKEGRRFGHFKCRCGIEKDITLSYVKSGSIQSCGCFRKERTREMLIKRNTKYDQEIVKHPLYSIWADLKRHHGVKEEWLNYTNFYNWAIDKYQEGLCCHNTNKEISNENNIKFVERSVLLEKCYTLEAKEKAKKTNLERYGVEYASQSDEIKEKICKTNLEKYGYEHHTQNPEIKEKISQSMIQRFGVSSAMQNEEIKNKARQTNVEKYGGASWTSSPEHMAQYIESRKQRGDILQYQDKTITEWSKELGICNSTFTERLNKYGWELACSMEKRENGLELFFCNILDQLKVKYERQVKIDNIYADFLLTDYNIVIEADGLYWHSDSVIESPSHHKRRQEKYKVFGYKSLFFREDEILYKTDIITSIVSNKINQSNRIFGRKTSVVEVDTKQAKEFFNNNHLMDKGSGKTYGLVYNNELVTCIQVVNKQDYIDISRFCHKLNTSVIGGFSKLIKHIDNLYEKDIATFIDQRYGSGEYLLGLGFQLVSNKISFRWCRDDKTCHRMKFPKNSGYDNRHSKIWDCGQAKYLRKRPE